MEKGTEQIEWMIRESGAGEKVTDDQQRKRGKKKKKEDDGRRKGKAGEVLAHRGLQEEEMLCTFSGCVHMGVIFSCEGSIKWLPEIPQTGQGKGKGCAFYLLHAGTSPIR